MRGTGSLSPFALALLIVVVSTIAATVASVGIVYATDWIFPEFTARFDNYAFAIAIPIVVAPALIFPFAHAVHHLKEMQLELERRVRLDALTGLPNRHAFFEHADRILIESDRSGAPVALMMVDVDRFKTVNDTFGHAIGDELLRHVAWSIERAVSIEAEARNLPARIGGDEFAVILIGLNAPAACAVAERICRNVQGGCRLTGAEPHTTSVSIGITFRLPGQDVDEAMKEADDAAYRAKRTGRDRWVLAAEADNFERDAPELRRRAASFAA